MAGAAGEFRRLDLGTLNPGHPCVAQGRIYFVADRCADGAVVGNVFSCAMDGSGLRQHTQHRIHYARHLQTDGCSLVYQCAGDIHLLPAGVMAGEDERLRIPW